MGESLRGIWTLLTEGEGERVMLTLVLGARPEGGLIGLAALSGIASDDSSSDLVTFFPFFSSSSSSQDSSELLSLRLDDF